MSGFEEIIKSERQMPNFVSEDRVALMIEHALASALEDHETKMVRHMDNQFGQLRDTFKSAYPNGDPHGHRLAHESQIKTAASWDRLKAEVVGKFLTGGLWLGAGWVLLQLWKAFVSEVKG